LEEHHEYEDAVAAVAAVVMAAMAAMVGMLERTILEEILAPELKVAHQKTKSGSGVDATGEETGGSKVGIAVGQ